MQNINLRMPGIALAIAFFSIGLIGQDLVLRSPGGRAEARINIGKTVSYSIVFDGKPVISNSSVALSIKEAPSIGTNPKLVDQAQRTIDQKILDPVPAKRRQMHDNYNELTLTFAGNYGMVWRAYDNGVAYRWVTDLADRITISSERMDVNLDKEDMVLFTEGSDFFSHNEGAYLKQSPKDLKSRITSLPLVVAKSSGVKLWLSEADLYDYAGMWAQGNSGKGIKAVFPYYPAAEQRTADLDIRVAKTADYIAQTSGKREFPWRVFGLAAQDKDLLDNDIVYQLSSPMTGDFSWVRPGKVAWDWWNNWNIYGVDFKAGLNTETYKYYIDFAAKYGIEYVILDEGWSKTDDITSPVPAIDLPALLAYAKQKNVGIILWVFWGALDKNMETVLDKYQQWGVKGLKIDFMQRDDQKVVDFYERAAAEAAKRHLIVDFHGAYKPTGLERRYPNVLSFEGVKGLEHSKFFNTVTPEHDLTIPFIRMTAGPMDYTPGAMLNSTQTTFQISNERPMSQGTRCHQLAMYVLYTSPLQMLADSPSNYYREPLSMEFLAAVPSVWDDTIAIDGKIGEYAVVARKAASGDWYLGAITNWTKREFTIDLSFLDNGTYDAQIFQDGPNIEKMPSDIQKVVKTVTKTDKLNISMAAGGGFTARFVKK